MSSLLGGLISTVGSAVLKTLASPKPDPMGMPSTYVQRPDTRFNPTGAGGPAAGGIRKAGLVGAAASLNPAVLSGAAANTTAPMVTATSPLAQWMSYFDKALLSVPPPSPPRDE